MGASGNRAGKIAGIVFAAVVVAFFVGSFFFDRMVLDQTYARTERANAALLPTYEAFADDYPRTPVEFQMQAGTLRGYVYQAESPRGFIVFRHGIFSQHLDYLALISAMVDRGWTVFAYDAIGCGESDGDNVIGMAQSPLDVAAAVDFVRETGLNGDLPLILWGHSWGGYGVAGALDLVPDVDACVTMSGFNEPCGILFETVETNMGMLGLTQEATLWLNNKLAFGADADRAALTGINKTSAPVLVMHGTGDAVISYNGASIIAQRDAMTNPGVEFLTFDAEGRNGHNSYFYSEEANAYLDETRAKLKALEEAHPDGAPESDMTAFWADFDVRRGNQADPALIDAIDDFLTRAIGGNMNDATTNSQSPEAASSQASAGFTGMSGLMSGNADERQYGQLQSALFANSGNSLGNRYEVEALRTDDGTLTVVVRQAEMHSMPTAVDEYRAPDDLLDQIGAIVDRAGMKDWGELPVSEFIAYDASTPRISLTYADANPDQRYPLRLSYSTNDELPDNGDALWEIRDLMLSCVSDATLIRSYEEPLR